MPFHHRCDFCLIIRFLISGGLAILMSGKLDIVYTWETTLGLLAQKQLQYSQWVSNFVVIMSKEW